MIRARLPFISPGEGLLVRCSGLRGVDRLQCEKESITARDGLSPGGTLFWVSAGADPSEFHFCSVECFEGWVANLSLDLLGRREHNNEPQEGE